MASSRLRLESLGELEAQIVSAHGSGVRILSVERVTVGGIRGWLARRHYEVVVEVPGSAAPDAAGSIGASDIAEAASSLAGDQARMGIAALLAEADDSEALLNRREPAAEVSTASESFVRLLEDLAANTAPS